MRSIKSSLKKSAPGKQKTKKKICCKAIIFKRSLVMRCACQGGPLNQKFSTQALFF